MHDLTPVSELLHGEEDVVYSNAGYQGLERRREMENKGVRNRMKRPKPMWELKLSMVSAS